jgi:hypothetical protein
MRHHVSLLFTSPTFVKHIKSPTKEDETEHIPGSHECVVAWGFSLEPKGSKFDLQCLHTADL